MFFWNKICGAILLFLMIHATSFAQNFNELRWHQKTGLLKNTNLTDSFFIFSSKKIFLNPGITAHAVPENFSICNYGFFCKKELKVEKAIKIPLRIRLGSLQQCNYYEGKP